MTPGQRAYEADVAAKPIYHDGSARMRWDQLCDVARWSWERDPTPRHRPTPTDPAPVRGDTERSAG